jgi:tetratricopeptide (TPR) repeat protein
MIKQQPKQRMLVKTRRGCAITDINSISRTIALLFLFFFSLPSISFSAASTTKAPGDIKTKVKQLREQAKAEADRGVPENAFNLLDEAIQLDPTDALTYRDRGILYIQFEQPDDGILDLAKSISINPNDPYSFYFRGIAYFDKQEYDRSIADCTAAMRLPGANQNPLIQGSRAEAYLKKGDFQKASEDYSALIAKYPNETTFHYYLGVAYIGVGRNDDAIKELQTVLKIEPRFFQAKAKLGLVYSKTGKADQAKKYFSEVLSECDKAISSNPDQAVYRTVRSEIYTDMGDKSKAAEEMKAANQLVVQNMVAFGNLALSAHYHDRAIASFTKAIKADPSNASLYRLRASAYQMKGKQAYAKQDEMKAAELSKGR